MILDSIQASFHEKVSEKISLVPEGFARYRVLNPFVFDDGDHLCIILRQADDGWVLSDEGHTFMRLTYEIEEKDLLKGTRQKVISKALNQFGVEDVQGELLMRVRSTERYGDALYSFVQALLKISDVTYLSRERVRSTFLEDFRALICEAVPADRLAFDWYDQSLDPRGMYTVDCRVDRMPTPLFVFALPGDEATRDAHIRLLQFEKWGIPHRSAAVFEDQEEINRAVLARFTDACGKMFSSLAVRDRIAKYVQDVLAGKEV